jgi:hypothetical protein
METVLTIIVLFLRFSIQTGNELPILFPRVQVGQTNPNLTVYSVSMKNTYATDGTGILKQTTRPLIYEPWNNISAPTPPLLSQDISSGYYFVNSYDQVAQMLNKALKTCFNAHFGVTDTTSPYAGREPYVEFDPQKNLFALYGEQLLHDPQRLDSSGNPMPYTEIYLNTRLYQLLSTFPSQFAGNPGELNYRIVFNNTRNTNLVTKKNSITGNSLVMIPVYQEISTVSVWNPVASIVFCSSLIPIIPTNTSPPVQFGDNSTNFRSGGANNNLTNILTDFEISITETNQYRPTITYSVSGEYRLIDMNSVQNLNKLDLLVFWKSQTGDLVPLRLQPGCAAHIKLLFRRRNFHGGY